MRLIAYDRDVAHRAQQLLPWTFRQAARLAALVGAYGDVVQATEDELAALSGVFDVDDATGPILDLIGLRVGEARDGRVDAVYRRFIRARIQRNRSRGEGWRVGRIARLMLGGVVVSRRRAAPRLLEVTVEVESVRPFAERAAVREAVDEAASIDGIVHVLERVEGEWLSWDGEDGAGWAGRWIELC